MDRPTEPIPPAGGWGEEPPGGWGAPPPDQPPRGRPPWWRQGWVLGVVGFLLGAFVANAGQGEQVRTVTVTSIVTSLVTLAPTTTTRRPTTTEPATTTTRRPRPATTTTRRPRPPTTQPPAQNCDPSYPDFCIPPPPPDLNCADISGSNFTVLPPDPHRFDREGDGLGCES
jgi:hypothetical protein